MSEKRRQFTREFKLEAVRLVKQGQSVSSVAAALGIRADHGAQLEATSRRQRREQEIFRGHGRVTSQEEELRRLRRELAQVTEERDFLKKAAAYFAKEDREVRLHSPVSPAVFADSDVSRIAG